MPDRILLEDASLLLQEDGASGFEFDTAKTGLAIYDSFSDADGTALNTNPADNGGTWTADSGMTMQNRLLVSNAAFKTAHITGPADGRIELICGGFSHNEETRFRAEFRYTDGSNHWQAYITRGGDGGFRRATLARVAVGVTTKPIEIDPGTVNPDTNHVLGVQFVGDQISLYFDGVQIGTTQTDSFNQTVRSVGLAFSNGGWGWIDEFSVWSIEWLGYRNIMPRLIAQ